MKGYCLDNKLNKNKFAGDCKSVVRKDSIGAPRKQDKKNVEELPFEALESNFFTLNNLSEDKFYFEKAISDTSYLVNKAHTLCQKVKAENRIVDYLQANMTYSLPLGINKNIAGIDYLIVFDSARITPEGGFMDAFMSIEIPHNGQKMAFYGGNIKFTTQGISSTPKLKLIENISVKIGEKVLLNINGKENKTFVNWDCGGFKSLSIDGEVEFSRDLFIPETSDGSPISEGERLKAKLTINELTEWGNFITKVSLPSFQVRGVPGFSFTATEAMLDYGNLANPPGITFPDGYKSSSDISLDSPLWNGVYIKNLSVKLPPQFKAKDKTRIEFPSSNFIIDDMGLTGSFLAESLTSIEKGEMEGRKISIDSIGVRLMKNELIEGEMKGRMLVPAINERNPIPYKALISKGGKYIFSLTTTSSGNNSLLREASLNESESSVLKGREKSKSFIDDKMGSPFTLTNIFQLAGGQTLDKVIEEMSPLISERKVSVLYSPSVSFSREPGKEFTFLENNNQRTLRIVLDYFKIMEGDKVIAGSLRWSESKDIVFFKPFDILPPQKTIRAFVRTHVEELMDGNWKPVFINGKVVEEIKENIFETGELPHNIPIHNVSYSYPMVNQYNFYKDEYKKGYIQLEAGQDYLFEPATGRKQVVRFETNKTQTEIDFIYHKSERKITFNLPHDLTTNTNYKLSIVNIPLNKNLEVDKNLLSNNLFKESEIFSTYFRTSNYSTFKEKVNSLKISSTLNGPIVKGIYDFGVTLEANEFFDHYEIKGSEKINPVIQCEASNKNSGLIGKAIPLMNEGDILNNGLLFKWDGKDSLDIFSDPTSTVVSIIYDLPYYTYKDYCEHKEKAAIQAARGKGSKVITTMIESSFPGFAPGLYKFKLKYVLPGLNTVTTEREISIKNP